MYEAPDSKKKSKYELTLLAKLAQQTERYEQMVEYAKLLLESPQQLSSAQRNLCSSAYKNLINNRRAQLKVLDAISDRPNFREKKEMISAINKYKNNIRAEFIKICEDAINIIQRGKVIRTWAEPIVFFLKLRADFYRYLCEVYDSEERKKYRMAASSCYDEADTIARARLPPINEVRLSLHLNMSVFIHEQLGDPEKALDLANRAFDEGVANVNETNEESYKNCTMILQLIRDNINLWSQQVDA